MSTATIELYNALVKAGIDTEKAKEVAESLVTQDDAKHFATKEDIAATRADIKQLETTLYKALAVQTIAIVGAVVGLLQVL